MSWIYSIWIVSRGRGSLLTNLSTSFSIHPSPLPGPTAPSPIAVQYQYISSRLILSPFVDETAKNKVEEVSELHGGR